MQHFDAFSHLPENLDKKRFEAVAVAFKRQVQKLPSQTEKWGIAPISFWQAQMGSPAPTAYWCATKWERELTTARWSRLLRCS